MEIEKLTPSEITNLWNSYLTNTMAFWVTKYFITKTQDEELRKVLEYAEEIAKIEVEKSKAFLEDVNHPLPQKFDQHDVDLNAPAICTDDFTAILKYEMAKVANVVYSMSVNTSTRKDIREFYQECSKNSTELTNRFGDLIAKKGLHHPVVHIPTPNQSEKVSKQRFLAGWFADRRPLNSVEIGQLVYNFKSTEMTRTFIKAMAKVTPTKSLQKLFERGVSLYEKHLDIFQSIVSENHLPHLRTWEDQILDSAVSPFSDRLMLYKMHLLASATVGRYGTSLSIAQRRDLASHYSRLMTEVLQFAEDSVNLMIELGFMDQLPMAREKVNHLN
ncbi:DUF3231 family protein [Ammoniphilus sp. YIM 78166]|uniref:DUF3231 family protein n=1 Tax=Ammoniphilus sp. YIM 78166 TaxID=1644106 RepID=UPI001431D02D|nr:DUF3231 family protein [Ammoniphilus sp. YIM 78166]